MVGRFTAERSAQREWAWLLALYLFLGSLGGGLFLLVRLFGLPASFSIASIGLVLVGVVVLLLKLGSPQRAWRAISRPATSWVSRGVWSVTGFIVFGFLSVAPSIGALSWLPWNGGTALGTALAWVAALFALLTMLYPGFVVSSARAIPFWNSPLLPLLFFAYAGLAATGVVLIGSAAADGAAAGVVPFSEALIVVTAALSAVYLLMMRQAGGSARASVQHLNQGWLGALYWIGVVLVGWILPLALLLWLPGAAAATVLAGAFIQIGALLLRYCVLRAGVYYVPATVTPAAVDFGTLTRTSADFAHEYAGMAGTSALGRRR